MDDDQPRDKIILPEKYYLTYFLDLIRFVEQHSAHLLDLEDQAFLDQFQGLSENAQCLFIRFVNRKGLFFREDKLNYEEIDSSEAIQELSNAGFISPVLQGSEEILRLFTKAELIKAYAELEIPKTIKKDALYLDLITHDDYEPLVSTYTIVQVELQEAVEYIKMLFFGHYHAQMTEFVVRDVGHVQIEDLSKHDFKPWFATLEEAKAAFDISQIKSELGRALRLYPASLLHDTLREIDFPRYQAFRSSTKILNKLLLNLARQLEREKEPELALFYYEQCSEHPSRERRIRLHLSLGQDDEAVRLAEDILQQPKNASELIFAQDFINRPKKKILRSTTYKLKDADHSITVTPEKGKNVERLAIEHFAEQGYTAIHGENYLWRNLFGLTFWHELLDASYDSFHHPLQRTSSDIHNDSFFEKRGKQLAQRLQAIRTRKTWTRQIQKVITTKTGISNQFVYWHPDIEMHMETMLTYLPLKAAKAMMLEMAKNLKENSKGFPDLMIWKEDSYFFYEVKSPNDQLSPQQLFWINFMQSNKIATEVLRVSYLD